LSKDAAGSSGVAAWALAHVYDAEGRVSEGASTFTGHGVEYYESCGFLFFDARMGGLGSRFIMDRSGASADRVALRLYDEQFTRILEYSGYDGSHDGPIVRRVPSTRKQIFLESAGGAASSMFGRLFGQSKDTDQNKSEEIEKEEDLDAFIQESQPRSLEDVLTWLPPTVNILTDATFLLFRLTISGAVDVTDDRWKSLRAAWNKIVDVERTYPVLNEVGEMSERSSIFSHALLARVASSLVLDKVSIEIDELDRVSKNIEKAAHLMGSLMQVRGNEEASSTEDTKEKWSHVVRLLNEARTGWKGDLDSKSMFLPKTELIPDLEGFDLTLGNFLEHAICHAAIKSEDYGSLCVARSLCSESVTFRANSPENWFRYGVILEKLGDEENANDAFHASVSLGAGEGGRVGTQQ